MSQADLSYNELINNILENGKWDKEEYVRTVYEDGGRATTLSLINQQLKFDNGKEIPLLTTKRVPLKDPIKELFWIWQKMSNKVQDLRDVRCSVWNEWEREDGSIGKAYGWQLKNKYRNITVDDLLIEMALNGEFYARENVRDKFTKKQLELIKGEVIQLNQVDYLLYQLKKNPYSRRIKTTLWCVEDLDDMALEPCVYETHWEMWDDKLNLTVNVRSNDMALGNPYNIYQYSILHRLIAQVSNLPVGEICFNLDIPHLYNRHLDTIKEQINGEMHEAPTIWINPQIKSFFDFTLDDIKVENYKHNGNFKYEIAI